MYDVGALSPVQSPDRNNELDVEPRIQCSRAYRHIYETRTAQLNLIAVSIVTASGRYDLISFGNQ
jgi:hypothetical protein